MEFSASFSVCMQRRFGLILVESCDPLESGENLVGVVLIHLLTLGRENKMTK